MKSGISGDTPVLKAAAKAERDLFHLKQEILKLDIENPPDRSPLPALTRGGKVIDPEQL